MAIAGSQITEYGRSPLGIGGWKVWGLVTGPADYTAAGEVLTKEVASSVWGVRDFSFLNCSVAGGTDYATGAVVNFEPTPDDATNAGLFHFYDAVGAHAHDFKVIGGTAAAGTDALNIKTAIIGKEAATNATALGADSATKGGVLATAATTNTAEAAASTDYSSFTFWVEGIARG